jgi:hypothetical protein
MFAFTGVVFHHPTPNATQRYTMPDWYQPAVTAVPVADLDFYAHGQHQHTLPAWSGLHEAYVAEKALTPAQIHQRRSKSGSGGALPDGVYTLAPMGRNHPLPAVGPWYLPVGNAGGQLFNARGKLLRSQVLLHPEVNATVPGLSDRQKRLVYGSKGCLSVIVDAQSSTFAENFFQKHPKATLVVNMLPGNQAGEAEFLADQGLESPTTP